MYNGDQAIDFPCYRLSRFWEMYQADLATSLFMSQICHKNLSASVQICTQTETASLHEGYPSSAPHVCTTESQTRSYCKEKKWSPKHLDVKGKDEW